jgi:hypothetical protein
MLIADAELAARPLVQEIAESGDPVFAVMRRRTEHRIGGAGPEKPLKLRITAQFFDAKAERIGLVRIDQDARNPGASQHGGCGRTRQAAADDRNIGVLHRTSRSETTTFAPGKGKKGLVWGRKLIREPEKVAILYITRI